MVLKCSFCLCFTWLLFFRININRRHPAGVLLYSICDPTPTCAGTGPLFLYLKALHYKSICPFVLGLNFTFPWTFFNSGPPFPSVCSKEMKLTAWASNSQTVDQLTGQSNEHRPEDTTWCTNCRAVMESAKQPQHSLLSKLPSPLLPGALAQEQQHPDSVILLPTPQPARGLPACKSLSKTPMHSKTCRLFA